MNTMRKQSGFTLIELMIVIAIIAILMAIAVPAYQDYSIRTKVSEAVSVTGGAKLAVSETYQSLGYFPSSAASYGWSFDASDYVATSTITDPSTGEITVTTQNTGATPAPVLTFTPSTGAGRIDWTCAATTGEDKHIPAECR